MRFRLLGPLAVEADTGPVDIPGMRAHRMLVALALRPNHIVSTSFLVDALWGDSPPATCREQVYNCVAGLRRSLNGRDGTHVEVHRAAGGYRLEVDAERIDSWAFEAAVRSAGEAARGGDLPAAIRRIRAGLDLWHGDALEGVADGVLQGEATRLDELRITAYDQLFALELQAGNASDLIPDLFALVRRYPLRDRLAHHLGTALHRTGRSAEALDACRRHRRILIEEFGLEPGPELLALEREIVTQTREIPRLAAPGPVDAERLTGMLDELSRLLVDIRHHLGAEAVAFDLPVLPTIPRRDTIHRRSVTGTRTEAA